MTNIPNVHTVFAKHYIYKWSLLFTVVHVKQTNCSTIFTISSYKYCVLYTKYKYILRTYMSKCMTQNETLYALAASIGKIRIKTFIRSLNSLHSLAKFIWLFFFHFTHLSQYVCCLCFSVFVYICPLLFSVDVVILAVFLSFSFSSVYFISKCISMEFTIKMKVYIYVCQLFSLHSLRRFILQKRHFRLKFTFSPEFTTMQWQLYNIIFFFFHSLFLCCCVVLLLFFYSKKSVARQQWIW